MVTRTDVAKRAGVSVATVSNVFNNNVFVLPETERKVRKAASELGDTPNFTARSLSLGHSYQIGIAISECTNPYHMEFFQAISDYAAENGFMAVLFPMYRGAENSFEMLRQRQFDALVNLSSQVYPSELVDILKRKDTIMVNCSNDGLYFSADLAPSMLEAMELLRANGHRKVAYISTVDKIRWQSDQRGKIFTENKSRFGFDTDERLCEFNDNCFAPSEKAGYDITNKLLMRGVKFTALFAMNDLAAIGAIRALGEAGLSVPDDVSVIGCDGIDIAEYTTPRLTSIAFDKAEMGRKIAEKVIEYITDNKKPHGETFITKTYLKTGNSVARVKPEAETSPLIAEAG